MVSAGRSARFSSGQMCDPRDPTGDDPSMKTKFGIMVLTAGDAAGGGVREGIAKCGPALGPSSEQQVGKPVA